MLLKKAWIVLAALMAPCPGALGQNQDAVVWATGLGERFRSLSNPVVSSYALGQLAALVCGPDPLAGAALFQQALTRAMVVPDEAFTASGPVLPVSSFTGLWKSFMPAATQCDPALTRLVDRGRVEARLAEDRRQANFRLQQAAGMDLAETPGRAAQLADAAITGGDPLELDMVGLTRFLSRLRERAPDLADDLFPKALELVDSGPSPQTQALNELGKYLFIDDPQYKSADVLQLERSTRIGTASITDFSRMRRSTNPDNVESYIEAVQKIATATGSPYYNAVSAYAMAYQALLMSRAMGLDTAMLDKLIRQIPIGFSEARQVLSFLGTSPVDEADLRRDRAIRRTLGAIRDKRFDEARSLLADIGDLDRRTQVRTLVTFREAASAIEEHQLDRAALLANTLQPGVKRAILYTGIIAAAPADFALQELGLALKDAESLPAEYRVAVYSALAAAMIHADPDRALTVINEVVRSLEDARTSPRRARLDPRRTRTPLSSGAANDTDVPLIIVGDAKLFEVVDSGLARHNFQLQIPGVSAINLPAVIRKSTDLDPARLEAALLRLKDETRLAAALTALAELRLGQR